MLRFLDQFRRDESGATAIEYGVILAGVFLAIMVAVGSFGTAATGKIDEVAEAVVSAS